MVWFTYVSNYCSIVQGKSYASGIANLYDDLINMTIYTNNHYIGSHKMNLLGALLVVTGSRVSIVITNPCKRIFQIYTYTISYRDRRESQTERYYDYVKMIRANFIIVFVADPQWLWFDYARSIMGTESIASWNLKWWTSWTLWFKPGRSNSSRLLGKLSS